MTSFEEKQAIKTPKENNKRWLYIIVAVLVLVLIVIGIFLFAQKDSPNNEGNDISTNSSISSDLDASNDNTTSSEQQNSESQGNETSTPTSSNQTQASSKNEGDTTNSTSGNTSTNTSSSGTSTNNTTTSDSSQNSTTSNNTTTNNTSTNSSSSTNKTENNNSGSSSTTTNTQPKYNYVTATFENAYPTGYSAMYAPENAIVITKVNYKEESGNYVIPDTIDGKKVAAIMPSAFSDTSISSTVKSVTLPATVRTIWSDAFKDCFNLTDLYIKSAVIGIYEDAFPDSSKRNNNLTIHCKKDCRDFDFYYYRNIANKYNAEYEEWNG